MISFKSNLVFTTIVLLSTIIWGEVYSQSNGISEGKVSEDSSILSNARGANFSTAYFQTKCGLNYVHQEVILNQRLGGFNIAQPQPASIVIAGIPANAVIESAFLYYSIEGVNQNTPSYSFNITNPDGQLNSYTTSPIAFGPSVCWDTDGSASYRNDVTSIISGNGTYLLLGLPTFFIPGDSPDTNGASLFIIYSDPMANYTGTLIIEDGLEVTVVNSMNIVYDITGFTVPNSITNSTGFLLLSDDQDFDPMSVAMNGSNLPFTDNNALAMAEGPIGLVAGQMNSTHEVIRSGDDCVSISMTGMYYQSAELDCQPDASIPTLGQWGLIILGVLLLILGSVQVRSSQVKSFRTD